MSCGCGKRTLGELAAGAVKLARAELGLVVLQDAGLLEARRQACEACDRWRHGRCVECGCYTWAKTRLVRESCPLDRWPRLQTDQSGARLPDEQPT